MTKVKQLANNQFIITEHKGNTYFQSYDSIIAKIPDLYWYKNNPNSVFTQTNSNKHRFQIELDQKYWNYSKTTSKYRNQFLGETTKETQAKINSGEYTLTDLNQ